MMAIMAQSQMISRVRKEEEASSGNTVTPVLMLLLSSPEGHRRTGRGGGGRGAAAPPPIRAVCRHEFGQRVDINRANHNTCLNNTNLGSVTAVNEKKTTN